MENLALYQVSGRDKRTKPARQTDQACVRDSYEPEEYRGWLLKLIAVSPDDPARAVRVLTGALLACEGWVLTRTHEKGAFAVDFEFVRAACVEVYAVLIGCGLELSRESHLRMAELCHCTKNLIATRGPRNRPHRSGRLQQPLAERGRRYIHAPGRIAGTQPASTRP